MNKKAPIGIFDSGIGGLTVANAIQKLMPNERIIYFGDTAHLPYGEKSKQAIIKYSKAITRFLMEKECKAIVIACNTASAFAGKEVEKLAGNLIVQNVIDPVAENAVKNYKGGKVGVIATKGTISSRNYPRAIHKIDPDVKVGTLATPLLVPMIEEGYFNNNISKTIIKDYLSKKPLAGLTQLILGCTHFPLIEKEVETIFKEQKKKVRILNSADIVAESLQKELKQSDLLNPKKSDKKHEFYVSDFTTSFQKSTQQFFGEAIKLKELNFWKEE